MDAPARWNPNDLWVAVGYAIAIGVWAWLISRAGGSDVSPEPPGPAIVVNARYRMDWGGMTYDVVFRRGGAYEAFAVGGKAPCYLGTWMIRDGVLGVSERTLDQSPGCKWGWASNELSTINGHASKIKLRRLR